MSIVVIAETMVRVGDIVLDATDHFSGGWLGPFSWKVTRVTGDAAYGDGTAPLFRFSPRGVVKVDRKNWIEVSSMEIQVGDVIEASPAMHDTVGDWRERNWKVDAIEDYKIISDDEFVVERNLRNTRRYQVTRGSIAQVAVVSRWNGRCRCGANIYTGFSSIEHDGPCSF